MNIIQKLIVKKQKLQRLTNNIVVYLGVPAILIIFYSVFFSYQYPAEKITSVENILCILEMLLLGGLFTSMFIVGEKIDEIKRQILREEVSINANNLILNHKKAMEEILQEVQYK